MGRGLRETLEHALSVEPDLLQEGQVEKRFSPLIARCIRAANEVRIGKRPERDMAILIYGNDEVPPSTLRRLMSRTQNELESLTSKDDPDDSADETSLRGLWKAAMHLYVSGVDAFFLRQSYRTNERLKSVATYARDPYLLPLSISAGLFLSLFQSQTTKHSRVLKTMETTKRHLDAFNDSWDWLTIYIELQSIMSRRYGFATFETRISEISELLENLINGTIDDLSPQAQMIAATCAYVICQYENRPGTIVKWADVYRRASSKLNKSLAIYNRTADRMYLSAFMATKQYENAVPILEGLISRELRDSRATKRPVDITYYSWLADALLWLGRYNDVAAVIDGIHPNHLRTALENTRLRMMIQRSIAVSLAGDEHTAVDRRVSRMAMLRNESSDRRAGDHLLRLSALFATLICSVCQANVSKYTTTDVVEKLLLIHKTYPEIRACKRTSAFIRLTSALESLDRTSKPSRRRIIEIERLLETLDTTTSYTVYELVPYMKLVNRLFPLQMELIRPSSAPMAASAKGISSKGRKGRR